MTPPDSGAICLNPWLHGHSAVNPCRCGNKPDSGEREVCGAVIARVNGDDMLRCDQQRGHDGAHYVKIGAFGGAREDEVLLSRDLAQRILAALELQPLSLGSLAAELREHLPKEPK